MKLSQIDPKDIEVVESRAPLRLSDLNPSDIEISGPSKVESAGRGYAQGATFGTSDEGGAGLYALAEKYLPESVQTYLSGRNPNLDYQPTEKSVGELYNQYRDIDRSKNLDARNANPAAYGTGELGGALMTSMIPGVNAAKGTSLLRNVGHGIVQGATAGAGYSNEGDTLGVLKDAAMGGGLGAGGAILGKGIEKASDIVTPYIMKKIQGLGGGIKDVGGKLAEKATGATGKQVEKFKPGSGQRLIEEGYVQAFDDPAAIAAKAEASLNKSGERIGKVLQSADESGVKIDLVDYLEKSEAEVNALRRAGNHIEADALEARANKVVDDAQKMGLSEVSPSYMENVKRESQANINYNADTKPQIAGKKSAASMQRQSVEDAVGSQSPEALDAFKQDKDLFGFLAPVQEAAEKRANTLNQSPIGGLLDVATGTLGSATMGAAAGYGGSGDISGALMGAGAGAIGRRYIAPKIASTAAVGMHSLGNLVQRSPQIFGKYAQVLQSAAQRGPQGLASTNFLLQQTDPNYRMILDRVAKGEDDARNP